MTLRRWSIGLALYLIALAVLAPASLLAWLGDELSGGRVTLADVSGSFWSGRAERLEIRVPGGRPLALDKVSWRILPHRMLWGAAPVQVENKGGDLTLSARLSPAAGGVRLTDMRLQTALATLAPYISAPMAAGLRGDLSLNSQDISLAGVYRGRMTGEIRITAGRLPLGTYNLDFTGAGTRLNIRWNGPQGPRAMSGGGWWDGSLHMDGLPGTISR